MHVARRKRERHYVAAGIESPQESDNGRLLAGSRCQQRWLRVATRSWRGARWNRCGRLCPPLSSVPAGSPGLACRREQQCSLGQSDADFRVQTRGHQPRHARAWLLRDLSGQPQAPSHDAGTYLRDRTRRGRLGARPDGNGLGMSTSVFALAPKAAMSRLAFPAVAAHRKGRYGCTVATSTVRIRVSGTRAVRERSGSPRAFEQANRRGGLLGLPPARRRAMSRICGPAPTPR